MFANITPEIILETLSKLKPKNSSGKDNISTKLLKEIIESIVYPIAHLFNLSFKTGYTPSDYKCGGVGSFTNFGVRSGLHSSICFYHSKVIIY